MPEHPALAHMEKTLADSYRKEIDQEEKVWRTLPFFAATLALQLAALFQIIDKAPDPNTLVGKVFVFLLGSSALLSLTSLVFLAVSIYPRKFEYVAEQVALLAYTQDLIQ